MSKVGVFFNKLYRDFIQRLALLWFFLFFVFLSLTGNSQGQLQAEILVSDTLLSILCKNPDSFREDLNSVVFDDKLFLAIAKNNGNEIFVENFKSRVVERCNKQN